MAEEIDKGPIEEEQEQVNLSELPHIRDANYVSLYSNFAEASLSPWDLSLTFSVLGAHEGKTVVFERATVSFSPPLAKAVAAVLAANIRGYEAQFGEIVMPKGFGGARKKETQQEGGPGEVAKPDKRKSK